MTQVYTFAASDHLLAPNIMTKKEPKRGKGQTFPLKAFVIISQKQKCRYIYLMCKTHVIIISSAANDRSITQRSGCIRKEVFALSGGGGRVYLGPPPSSAAKAHIRREKGGKGKGEADAAW